MLSLTKIERFNSLSFLQRKESICIGIVFIVARIGHFVMTEAMVKMFFDFVPFKLELVLISGVFELVLGAMLIRGTQFDKQLGIALFVFLVLALPLNIKAAFNESGLGAKGPNYLYFRIPLQLFWMAWISRFIILKK